MLRTLDTDRESCYNLSVSNQPRLQSLINIGDIMDELDHLEFLDFMTEQELKAETIEANKELDEDVNPITKE